MYDDKTRRTALKMVRQGMSVREVSVALGGRPSEATIRKWLQGFEPTGKRGVPCVLTYAQKLDAILRVEGGEDYRDVAKDVGCTPSALSAWRSKWYRDGMEALYTRYDRVQR